MDEDWDILEEEIGIENNRFSRAERRKKEWKFANRRKNILANNLSKPLHYYSKNMPESHAFNKRRARQKQRQIDNYENQLEELFDEE